MKAKKKDVHVIEQFLKFFFFLTLCFSLPYCQNGGSSSSNSSYQIDSTKISLALSPNSLYNTRFFFSQSQTIDNTEYLIGYDWGQNQLEWFDLTNQKEVKIQKLSKDGPDGVPNLYSFYVHNMDSIFVLGMRSIKLIDINGKVKRSVPINFNTQREKNDIDFQQYSLYNTPRNTSPIFYTSSNKKLYLAVKPNVPRFSEEKFGHPLCVSYDLQNDRFEFIPIKLPEVFHNQFFPKDKPNLNFMEDRIIYTFPFSSNIYIYDHLTRSTQIFQGESQLIPNEVAPILKGELGNNQLELFHISTHSEFLPVFYSEHLKRYYRLAFAPLPEHEAKGKEGARGKVLLSVFNQELQLLDELLMDTYLVKGSTFISSRGFLLFPKNADEDILNANILY